MQIHRCYPVIVGSITAFAAPEEMVRLVTACLVSSPAYRTHLGCVCRIHLDDHLASQSSFIHDLLFKIIVRPGYRDITVFAFDPLSLRAYAGKILKNEHSAFGIMLSECLADAVIDVTHPTVLSLTDGLESSP